MSVSVWRVLRVQCSLTKKLHFWEAGLGRANGYLLWQGEHICRILFCLFVCFFITVCLCGEKKCRRIAWLLRWVRPCLATDRRSTLPPLPPPRPPSFDFKHNCHCSCVCRCSWGICGLRQAKNTRTALGDCFPLQRPLILDLVGINTSSTPLLYTLIKQPKLGLMDMHPLLSSMIRYTAYMDSRTI